MLPNPHGSLVPDALLSIKHIENTQLLPYSSPQGVFGGCPAKCCRSCCQHALKLLFWLLFEGHSSKRNGLFLMLRCAFLLKNVLTTHRIKKEGSKKRTNLSLWPVILLKNIIIHLCSTISHEHYSLAAHAAPSGAIKLQKDTQSCQWDTNNSRIDAAWA